ncbi:hypothetical protein EDB84DRAFT_1674556 [Lactarius hengduanensis]|nr:hypothetical protein EDB84DRAFT_1674556 [Lactarius hengduanensis]
MESSRRGVHSASGETKDTGPVYRSGDSSLSRVYRLPKYLMFCAIEILHLPSLKFLFFVNSEDKRNTHMTRLFKRSAARVSNTLECLCQQSTSGSTNVVPLYDELNSITGSLGITRSASNTVTSHTGHSNVRPENTLQWAKYNSRYLCHSFAHIQPAQPAVLHSSFLNPPHKALHKVLDPNSTGRMTPKTLLDVGRAWCPSNEYKTLILEFVLVKLFANPDRGTYGAARRATRIWPNLVRSTWLAQLYRAEAALVQTPDTGGARGEDDSFGILST